MNQYSWGSLILGLLVPFLGVIGGTALLGNSGISIMGIPVVYFWMFSWFVLTSVCLWASWRLFDRHRYAEESSLQAEEGEEL